VVDTNVLISAALSAQGGPAQLVQTLLAQHQLVFSQATFDELRTRLYRPKFDRYISLESHERLLHDFSASACWVDVESVGRYCRDRDDDVLIETTLQSQAYALVTGDADLLHAPSLPGLQVLTVAQALQHTASSPLPGT
jgi:putative PIN family toxin of toxin-antitoxin system